MTEMKLYGIQASIERPDSPGAYLINTTNPDDVGPLLTGPVTVPRRCTGPVGHHEATMGTLSIVDLDPKPWPIDSRVRVELLFRKPMGANVLSVLDCWIERDVVTWDEPRKAWRHTIDYVDQLGYLASRKTPVALPAQTIDYRLEALADLVTLFILPDEFGIASKWRSTQVVALPAGTDLLTALRGVADSIGHRLMVIGGDAPLVLVPDAVAESAAPSWWNAPINDPDYWTPIELTDKQLTYSPVALSRTSHISTTELGVNIAGADVTQVVTDNGRYATLRIATGIKLATAGTASTALTAIKAFAAAAAGAPAESSPTGPVRLLDVDAYNVGGVLHRILMTPVPMIKINPRPAQLPQMNICDGWTMTIDPDLSVNVELTLTPASLYGLVPIRASHIGSKRCNEAFTTYDFLTVPFRFVDLAANRIPT